MLISIYLRIDNWHFLYFTTSWKCKRTKAFDWFYLLKYNKIVDIMSTTTFGYFCIAYTRTMEAAIWLGCESAPNIAMLLCQSMASAAFVALERIKKGSVQFYVPIFRLPLSAHSLVSFSLCFVVRFCKPFFMLLFFSI